MFYLFNPHHKHKNEEMVLEEINKKVDCDLGRHEKSHKLVYHEPAAGIYGCAFLSQKRASRILPLSFLKGKDRNLWVLEDYDFVIENDSIHTSSEDFTWHWRNFFSELLEKVKVFAINQEISEVYLHLNAQDHRDITRLGNWPVSWKIYLPEEMVFSQLPLGDAGYKRYNYKKTH